MSPPDEFLQVLPTTSSITLQPEQFLSTTGSQAETTPVYQQDHTSNNLQPQQNSRIFAFLEISFSQPSEVFSPLSEHYQESLPAESNIDQHLCTNTPVHQVEPVLETTPLENHWLQKTNQPQDITEILGTTAFKGYVKLPYKHLMANV